MIAFQPRVDKFPFLKFLFSFQLSDVEFDLMNHSNVRVIILMTQKSREEHILGVSFNRNSFFRSKYGLIRKGEGIVTVRGEGVNPEF